MSFVPLTGPATLAVGARPRAGVITFSDGPEGRRRVDLPIVAAVPVLTRALGQEALHPTVGLLAASAHFALRLVTAGKYEATTFDGEDHGWLPVVLGDDVERLRLLAEFRSYDGLDAEAAEAQVWAMVAAAVDSMATPGAARLTMRRSAPKDEPPAGIPVRRGSRLARASERQQRITLSLRIEADEESLTEGIVRMVLQVHDQADPLHFADASVLWHDDPSVHGFGPRVRSDIAVRLGEAAAAWPVLDRMRFAATPTELILEGDDLVSLLADGIGALRGIGVDVLWPRSLGRELRAQAVLDLAPTSPAAVAPSEGGSGWEAPLRTGLLATEEIAAFRWHVALGGEQLTEEEMTQLAEAASPILRLRGSWTIVDPAIARKAKDRLVRRISGVEALGAVLAGDAAVALPDATAPGLPDVIVGASLERLRDQVAGAGLGELLPEPPGLDATLRDYQRRGMTWLAEITALGLGGCLADDMGLGKTITLIALHLHRQAHGANGPTLVVCPATVLGNWEAEIRRFAPGVPVHRFHGSGRMLPERSEQGEGLDLGLGDPGFVLTTYGTARRDARLLATRHWDLVVADEAQHLKNPASATARGMRLIPSAARVALTGTPVENNLADLWALLDWCVPGLLGTRKAFRKAWASPIESGVENAAKQFASMVAPFLLRRRKTDPGIAPELPPKTETDHVLSLTKEQTVLYEAFVRDTMTRIERLPGDDPSRRGLILAMLTGLKQICNHPAQFLRHDTGKIAGRSEKVELLDDLIDTATSEGGAVLVFTQYVALGRLLSRYWSETGLDHLFLHGGTSVREREAMVRTFQSGGEAPAVFLLSLKAGGTGLNLTRADHVVHVDRWWNPAVEDQASDRAWRLGQTRPVQVHRLLMRGTLEERIALLLEHKRSLAEAVLGAGESALTELSNAELRDLVTLDRSWR